MLARRRLRIICVQSLYQHFLVQTPLAEILTFSWHNRVLSQEDRLFCTSAISGVIDNQESYEKLLEKYSESWNIDRMALLTRIILLLGVHFILNPRLDSPGKVVISECLDLTIGFCGREPVAFVNAILDQILHKEVETQSDKS